MNMIYYLVFKLLRSGGFCLCVIWCFENSYDDLSSFYFFGFRVGNVNGRFIVINEKFFVSFMYLMYWWWSGFELFMVYLVVMVIVVKIVWIMFIVFFLE